MYKDVLDDIDSNNDSQTSIRASNSILASMLNIYLDKKINLKEIRTEESYEESGEDDLKQRITDNDSDENY